MIVSRIDGGLGNQLFQYAFGWYTAQRNNVNLVLDLSAYEDQPEHGYLLDQLQIEARTLQSKDLERIPSRYQSALKRPSLATKILEWPLRKLAILDSRLSRTKEKPFGFKERYLSIGNNRYLVGYWQSERFFPGIRSDLLRQFRPAKVSDQTSSLAERMYGRPSIALHVRRGDYLTNPSAASIYERLTLDYYRSCLADRLSEKPNSEVYIFSNDLDWCRQEFDLSQQTYFVDHNDGSTAHEDMLLISHAQCCIIANSTFSWWGAWLNDRKDRVVYAPSRWFKPGTLDGTHILPAEWLVKPNFCDDSNLRRDKPSEGAKRNAA